MSEDRIERMLRLAKELGINVSKRSRETEFIIVKSGDRKKIEALDIFVDLFPELSGIKDESSNNSHHRMKYLIIEDIMGVFAWIHDEFDTEQELNAKFDELRRKSQSFNMAKYIVSEEKMLKELERGILSYVSG